MKHRQARASGQPRVATARRCLRSVSAVACCSSNGRGCGRTIAGRRAAATSATQLWPAWVITTSAAQMSGHGSGVLGPPRRPNVFQVISGIDAAVASTVVWSKSTPPVPLRTRTVGAVLRRLQTVAVPETADAADIARLGGVCAQPFRLVKFLRPCRDDVVGDLVDQCMRTVGAFARHRHHDHRHTKQSDEERNFNRHVDHHGCWSRYFDPSGDERHPRHQAVVVMRNPMQCTICRRFRGSRTGIVTRKRKDGRERMRSRDVQRCQRDHRMAKLSADAEGPIEVTGAVVVDVVADHGASHSDRRSSCGRGGRTPLPISYRRVSRVSRKEGSPTAKSVHRRGRARPRVWGLPRSPVASFPHPGLALRAHARRC